MKERKMNYFIKRLFMFALLFVLAQGVVTYASAATETVQAAVVKKGLKKEGKYYYYYVNGKRVTNCWKNVTITAKGKKSTYKYYFGKNGRAYAAPDMRESGHNLNVVLKKIGKYYYGFNRVGRMVKNGYYNDPKRYTSNGDTYTYYFDKYGRMNLTKSKAIRTAGKYEANAARIRSILGKPRKTIKLNSCFGEPGDDYKLVYEKIYVTIHRYPDEKEMVFGIFPR